LTEGGSSSFNKCRAYSSGSERRKNAKEAKTREEEVATRSRNIQVTILHWQWSPAETFLRNL